jgi:hypothetical protein
MKWIGERISFVEDKQKMTVVIYPDAKGWVKSMMGAWFAMWVMIGAVVIWSYFTFKLTEQENIIIYIFMAFWAYYAIRVGRSFFWLLWGKELIKIDEAAFIYKKSIKTYGSAKRYLLENISKMRMHELKEGSFQAIWEASPWVKGGERLEFDYLSKVVRIGRKVSEKDGKLLFKLLSKRIDQNIRKMK